ncbi:hypothetical protein FC19_GL000149 [Liquorilactobacillus aquaticus DSM 21051]|uniref:Acyltransferase 3 domain-containing protein n=1 Tax=Liquorilactobacillus aquaticus DSM 21051 TaxID=1423725 RepID=A0A0R2D2V4_9LACO|nr:acyltransferase family protein [Liquorilactobacillus aquaticus]KRM94889.1 hypothetical protein FC19_GL000149 [Liquorilactobacillus aquaticus DSM 21051]
MKRNYGIDLIKVIACIQVIMLHNFMKYFDGGGTHGVKLFSQLVYLSATSAIPLFFLANGFFVLNKSNLNLLYWLNKTKKIILVMFIWLFLYSLKDLIKDHSFTFFRYVKGTIVEGIPLTSTFIHFWFFWSLIIVLFFAPLLAKILKNKVSLYILLVLLLLISCIIINVFSYLNGKPVDSWIYQPFRLYNWLMYYMLGGLIGKFRYRIEKIINKYGKMFFLSSFTIYILFVVVCFILKGCMGSPYTEYNYTNILLIISVSMMFSFFACKKDFYNHKIYKTQSLTMGIYIIHPFVLKKVYSLFPYPTILGSLAVFSISLFVCLIIVFIMKHIKYISKLVEL